MVSLASALSRFSTLCYSEKWILKDAHVLIPNTCEYVTLLDIVILHMSYYIKDFKINKLP